MMWSLIINGLVHELTATDPTGRFAPGLEWVAVPAAVSPAQGWSYAGGMFTAPPAPATPTLAQQAAALLATGLAITSTATAALDATYSASATAQAQINAEVTSILLNGTFADGTSTIDWLDVSGVSHTFTIAQFKLLATKIAIFVSGCVKCVNGQTTVLPNTSATIL